MSTLPQKVVCVGDCGVDHYVELDLVRPGGCSLNVAVTLARLAPPELSVEVVSAVGTDRYGTQVLAALAAERLTAHVTQLPGTTSLQRLSLAGGERRFVGYSGGVLPDLTFDPAQLRTLSDADLVMTVVYEQIEDLVRRLIDVPRQGRLAVDCMDLSDYGHSLGPVLWVLDQAQVAFFGLRAKEDAGLIGEIRELTVARPLTAIVTLGAHGGVAFQGGDRHEFVAPVAGALVDTTGAGDAFAGAFLSRHLTGASIDQAAAFASRHATGTVAHLGAF